MTLMSNCFKLKHQDETSDVRMQGVDMSQQHGDTRSGRVEAHRLDAFFDAAFAFAVSLLAIAGTEIPQTLHDLTLALYRIPAFACSFATLLVFWYRHVRWRERFRIHDFTSIALSLTLVFFALIFVYPLNMVFSSLFNAISIAFTGTALPKALELHSMRELSALYICYGLGYASMAGTVALLYLHSIRQLHGASRAQSIEARESLYVQAGSMLIALLSIGAALMIPPTGGIWSAVPGFMYVLLSVVYAITGRWGRRMLARSA
jgi:uncharacterized membrane protein